MDSPFSVLVSDLLGRPGARRQVVLEGEMEISLDQVQSCGPVRAVVDLEAIINGLVARAQAQVRVVMVCNRCLGEVPRAITAQLTCAFHSGAGSRPSEDAGSRGESDDGVEYDLSATDGWIDFRPVLHDELSLAVPLVVLCDQECQGLCPTCGADLNVEPCGGHSDSSDSPFAQLKDLLDRM